MGDSRCIGIAVSKAVKSFCQWYMNQCQPSLWAPSSSRALGNGLCGNGVSGCLVTCLRSCASLAPCLEVVDGSWLLWFTSRSDRVLHVSQWSNSQGVNAELAHCLSTHWIFCLTPLSPMFWSTKRSLLITTYFSSIVPFLSLQWEFSSSFYSFIPPGFTLLLTFGLFFSTECGLWYLLFFSCLCLKNSYPIEKNAIDLANQLHKMFFICTFGL